MEESIKRLKYLGGGFLVGVPSRDLTEEEARIYGESWLIASGLYKKIRKPKVKKPAEKLVTTEED